MSERHLLSDEESNDQNAIRERILERLRENDATLTTLNLSGNNIDHAGAKDLAEAIKNNTALTTLNLSGNNIDHAGAKELAEVLKTNTTALTNLNLTGNTIKHGGATELAVALKINRVLTTLNLSGNNIDQAGAKELAEALKTNKALTNLNLRGNNINDWVVPTLAQALKTNKALTNLNLSGNNIKNAGAKELAQALKTNTVLANLNLSGNNIKDEGAKDLEQALETNTTLTTLDLSLNMISDGVAKKLLTAVRNNSPSKDPELGPSWRADLNALEPRQVALRTGTFQFDDDNTHGDFVYVPRGFDFTTQKGIDEILSALDIRPPDLVFQFETNYGVAPNEFHSELKAFHQERKDHISDCKWKEGDHLIFPDPKSDKVKYEMLIKEEVVQTILDTLSEACAQTSALYLILEPHAGNVFSKFACQAAKKKGVPSLGLFVTSHNSKSQFSVVCGKGTSKENTKFSTIKWGDRLDYQRKEIPVTTFKESDYVVSKGDRPKYAIRISCQLTEYEMEYRDAHRHFSLPSGLANACSHRLVFEDSGDKESFANIFMSRFVTGFLVAGSGIQDLMKATSCLYGGRPLFVLRKTGLAADAMASLIDFREYLKVVVKELAEHENHVIGMNAESASNLGLEFATKLMLNMNKLLRGSGKTLKDPDDVVDKLLGKTLKEPKDVAGSKSETEEKKTEEGEDDPPSIMKTEVTDVGDQNAKGNSQNEPEDEDKHEVHSFRSSRSSKVVQYIARLGMDKADDSKIETPEELLYFSGRVLAHIRKEIIVTLFPLEDHISARANIVAHSFLTTQPDFNEETYKVFDLDDLTTNQAQFKTSQVHLKASQIQDKITKVMESAFDTIPEMGAEDSDHIALERTARLINLLQNARERHGTLSLILQGLTRSILLLVTILTVVQVQVDDEKDQVDDEEDMYLYYLSESLTLVNTILPIVGSVLLAIDAFFRPSFKYAAYLMAETEIESEQFRYRTRTGVYRPVTTARWKNTRALFVQQCQNDFDRLMKSEGSTGALLGCCERPDVDMPWSRSMKKRAAGTKVADTDNQRVQVVHAHEYIETRLKPHLTKIQTATNQRTHPFRNSMYDHLANSSGFRICAE